jgi:hypothetical protein
MRVILYKRVTTEWGGFLCFYWHNSCYRMLWTALMINSCYRMPWTALMIGSCYRMLWIALMINSCYRMLWTALMINSCYRMLWTALMINSCYRMLWTALMIGLTPTTIQSPLSLQYYMVLHLQRKSLMNIVLNNTRQTWIDGTITSYHRLG